jgi:hypothetical protein
LPIISESIDDEDNERLFEVVDDDEEYSSVAEEVLEILSSLMELVVSVVVCSDVSSSISLSV